MRTSKKRVHHGRSIDLSAADTAASFTLPQTWREKRGGFGGHSCHLRQESQALGSNDLEVWASQWHCTNGLLISRHWQRNGVHKTCPLHKGRHVENRTKGRVGVSFRGVIGQVLVNFHTARFHGHGNFRGPPPPQGFRGCYTFFSIPNKTKVTLVGSLNQNMAEAKLRKGWLEVRGFCVHVHPVKPTVLQCCPCTKKSYCRGWGFEHSMAWKSLSTATAYPTCTLAAARQGRGI